MLFADIINDDALTKNPCFGLNWCYKMNKKPVFIHSVT